MIKKTVLLFTATLLLNLVGCGGNGSGPDPEIEAANSELRVIFAADPEGGTVDIIDDSELAVNIDRLFGDEDAKAIDITLDDTIGDVIARAGNG